MFNCVPGPVCHTVRGKCSTREREATSDAACSIALPSLGSLQVSEWHDDEAVDVGDTKTTGTAVDSISPSLVGQLSVQCD